MKFINYLNEGSDRQKFAFVAVKGIIMKYLGPGAEKITITKKDKQLKVKMPDTARSTVNRGNTGMEFDIDVEAKN